MLFTGFPLSGASPLKELIGFGSSCRLGRCFAEGRCVQRDREMATIWLWRAAQQKHERATTYLAKYQERAHPLHSLKKIFTVHREEGGTKNQRKRSNKQTKRGNKKMQGSAHQSESVLKGSEEDGEENEDKCGVTSKNAENPSTRRAMKAVSEPLSYLNLQDRAALKKAAGTHVSILEAEARVQAKAERLSRRANAAMLCDSLIDVTFHEEILGLCLVLATEHRTKRKMIIVEEVKSCSPAEGLLEIQDELVAIGDNFNLPNHLLVFDEIGKHISRQPRPLVLTFSRVHTHRPAPTERCPPHLTAGAGVSAVGNAPLA